MVRWKWYAGTGSAPSDEHVILCADSRYIPLPDNSVQCVVTSPPYWGLRQYADLGPSGIGLEESLGTYIANIVEVFREVRRVLRSDGVCWVNVGDMWAGSGKASGKEEMLGGEIQRTNKGSLVTQRTPHGNGLKPKDLIGLPWTIAFVLRADGWWLRDCIIWAKGISFDPTYSGSVMPESVRDRTTRSFEYVFLLTKQAQYFYDGDAEREELVYPDRTYANADEHKTRELLNVGNRTTGGLHDGRSTYNNPAGRNLRSVWAINPEPSSAAICHGCWRYYPDGPPLGKDVGHTEYKCSCGSTEFVSHYAAFPTRLAEACIRLGTSERGACRKCGTAWSDNGRKQRSEEFGCRRLPNKTERLACTTGWYPTCHCDAGEPVPCVVLDPFSGTGTTVLTARRLRRIGIGLDLSWPYCKLARARIDNDRPLLAAAQPEISPYRQHALWVS